MFSALRIVPVQDILPTFDAVSVSVSRKPYEFTSEKWSRTNNDLEGWHNRLYCYFQQRHAHIWNFIQGLISDSATNHHSMEHSLVGEPNPPQHRGYAEINQRTQALVNGYGNNNRIDFLRGISYNLA